MPLGTPLSEFKEGQPPEFPMAIPLRRHARLAIEVCRHRVLQLLDDADRALTAFPGRLFQCKFM